MSGIAIELCALLALQTLGTAIFARFEVEAPAWRKLLKWGMLIGVTLGLYPIVGHWALCFPLLILMLGLVVHFAYCRKHGIDPLRATPRRRYYELRGWEWKE